MESTFHTATVASAGFSRIFGYPVGIIGNNGVLFSESAKKVEHQSSARPPLATGLFFLTLEHQFVQKQLNRGQLANLNSQASG